LNDTATWKWKLAQTLEYKWWQNYLKNKDTDEYISWKCLYWNKLLHSISKYIDTPLEGKYIMDAGCGPAGVFMVLKGNYVTAIDPLLDKYKALQHFKPEKCTWVDFRNVAIEGIIEENKYDYIFCLNAINHVNDLERCYDNLVKALKPNGYLVVSIDAHRSNIVKKIFQFLPGDVLHPVQLNLSEYNEKLTHRGLTIVKDILYKREAIFDYYITIAQKQ